MQAVERQNRLPRPAIAEYPVIGGHHRPGALLHQRPNADSHVAAYQLTLCVAAGPHVQCPVRHEDEGPEIAVQAQDGGRRIGVRASARAVRALHDELHLFYRYAAARLRAQVGGGPGRQMLLDADLAGGGTLHLGVIPEGQLAQVVDSARKREHGLVHSRARSEQDLSVRACRQGQILLRAELDVVGARLEVIEVRNGDAQRKRKRRGLRACDRAQPR